MAGVGVVGERGLLANVVKPASSAAARSVSSRSSTWETRRVRVSFNTSSDSTQLMAGTIGQAPPLPRVAGRLAADLLPHSGGRSGRRGPRTHRPATRADTAMPGAQLGHMRTNTSKHQPALAARTSTESPLLGALKRLTACSAQFVTRVCKAGVRQHSPPARIEVLASCRSQMRPSTTNT